NPEFGRAGGEKLPVGAVGAEGVEAGGAEAVAGDGAVLMGSDQGQHAAAIAGQPDFVDPGDVGDRVVNERGDGSGGRPAQAVGGGHAVEQAVLGAGRGDRVEGVEGVG